MVRDERFFTQHTLNASRHSTPYTPVVIILLNTVAGRLIHRRPVATQYPDYVPLILVSCSECSGVSLSVGFVEDDGPDSPQVRDLVTPRRKKADVHVLLCSLLYSKVDVIPVVVLVVAFRIIPRSDEQLGGILIVQRPVAIPIGCPYAIFLCQRDGLQNVEALLVSRGNKHFDLLPGHTVEQLPVRVGQ